MNILYYVSVLLMCVHYCGNDPALDRFLQGLKEVLLRYGRNGNVNGNGDENVGTIIGN